MVALAGPSGDFPLNDDWVYALGVKSILQTGRFELPIESDADFFTQAYWGAVFCLPFGFSFTSLRFSTLTLGVVGIVALYFLLREIGGNRPTALLGSFTLASNPLYFGLAHTFMTDVPFLALMIMALWLFVRGLWREEAVSLAAGILIALATILIRQFAILLLLAFGVAYIMRKGVSRKALLVAIAPLVAGVIEHFAYQHWMDETGRTDFFVEVTPINLFFPTPLGEFVRYTTLKIAGGLPYLGFFTASFVASVAFSGPRTSGRKRWLIWVLVLALASPLLTRLDFGLGLSQDKVRVGVPNREFGNVLTAFGLGPLTLRDTFILNTNLPTISNGIKVFWIAIGVIAILSGTVIILYFVKATAQVFKNLWRLERWYDSSLQALVLVLVAGYATLLLLNGFNRGGMFDRYLLFFLPPSLVILLVSENHSESIAIPRWRFITSLAMLCIYATFSIAATHDYLAWNRARWNATRSLMAAGTSSQQIDGGYEFNGWFLGDRNYIRGPDKSFWFFGDDEYVIASGPVTGYHEISAFPFRRWLPVSNASAVVVLHRSDLEHH
jgi:hypothetical protein